MLFRSVVIDASARMIQLAQERLRQVDRALERVEFRHEAAQTALAACAEFELVVCNFFLDCFDASEFNALLPRIAASLTVGGQLWLGDFRPPKRGIARVLGPPLLAAMHSFFRWTAGISARRLADLPIVLRAHGWHPLQSVERAGGLLHASIWQRPAP